MAFDLTGPTLVIDTVAVGGQVSDAAPVAVTKATAAVGTSAKAARDDHKHDVATAAPVAVGGTLAEGSSAALARADHVHTHGTQAGGMLHAVATGSVAGFMSAADKTKLDTVASGAQVASFAAVKSALEAATADVSMNAHKLTGLAEPTAATHAATKNYADTAALDCQVLFPTGSGVSDKALIDAALAAIPAKGGAVLLAKGDWHYSGTPAFSNNRNIVFGGFWPTDSLTGGTARLYFDQTDASAGISIDNTGYSGSTYLTGSSLTICNLSLYEQALAGNVGSMFKIRNRAKLTIRNVVTYGGLKGFDVDTCYIVKFVDCKSAYAMKNAFHITNCNEVFFENCQGVGAGRFNGALAIDKTEGWGLYAQSCAALRWTGDLSGNGKHSTASTGDVGGGFCFDNVSISSVEGYAEASDSSSFSSTAGYFSSTAQGNDCSQLFHGAEMMVEDHGAHNHFSNTQTSMGLKVASGKVTNWLVDSSFERATPERWFGSAALSCQSTGTADGPVSGKCMRIKNNTGSAGLVLAEHYFSGINGVTSLVTLLAGDVVTYRLLARATRPIGGSYPSSLQLKMGASVPIAANGTPLPFLDTQWREVEFTGVMTADWADALIVLGLTCADQDYVEVGDGMLTVTRPGQAPMRFPYIRTGTGLTERTASLEVIDPTSINHNTLQNLSAGDVHTQYAKLAGRSGGQTIQGDTASGGSVTINSTAHATKGSINLGNAFRIDEANKRQLMGSGVDLRWYSSTDFSGSADTGLARATAGQAKVTNGGAGLGTLLLAGGFGGAAINFGAADNTHASIWESGGTLYVLTGLNSDYASLAAKNMTVNGQMTATANASVKGHVFLGNATDVVWNSAADPASSGNDTQISRGAAAGNLRVGDGSSGYGRLEMATSVTWQSGAGSPEGAITAAVGSLYTRTNGGAGTTLYVKESGSGNTGWIGK